MKIATDSTIQVLVEKGLQKPKRKTVGQPANVVAKPFQTFKYTSNPTESDKIQEVSHFEKSATASPTVNVFGFTKTSDLARARKLVKTYAENQQPMIAVTSPNVFNQPEFRSVLTGELLEVLVEEPDKFKAEHLKPWIAKLFQTSPLRKTSATKAQLQLAATDDPLEVGKRLRDPVSGRLDARKISELLGISITDLATKICGMTKQNLSQNPTSAGLQQKLQPLEEVAEALLWCGGDETKLRVWLNRPNRDFPLVDGKTPSPMDLILRGHAGIVAAKVHHLRSGHPA